ncbi:MAG: DUF6765 family protein [Polyangiaceae bacterium]
MDIDFHYYATFIAAQVAGYNDSEAAMIAHAAQYVDDSTPDRASRIHGVKPVVTTLSVGDEIGEADDWSTGTIARDRAMWTAFHFLPGNIDLNHPYHGAQKATGLFGSFHYDDLAKQEFRAMCLPDSPMAIGMVNDTVQRHATDLAMIGIRMHVLIDTFAHMLYSGSAAWHVNDVAEEPEILTLDGRYVRVAIPPFTYTPQGFYYNSIAYTGHGRMGHVPDLPWVTYRYKPQWSNTPIVKDNPTMYLRAFQEMVTAMRCIRQQRRYDPAQLDSDDQLRRVLEVVSAIIRIRPSVPEAVLQGLLNDFTDKRCADWIAALPALRDASGLPLSAPPKYSADAWLDQMKKHGWTVQQAQTKPYAKFHHAAATHLQWVKDATRDAGLTLLGQAPYATREQLSNILDKKVRIHPARDGETSWEVEDSSMENGHPLQLWDGTREENVWQIEFAGKGEDGMDRFRIHNPKLGRYATCQCDGMKCGAKPTGMSIRSFQKTAGKGGMQLFQISTRNVGGHLNYTFHVADEFAIHPEEGHTGNSTKLKVAQLGGDKDAECYFRMVVVH